ncbi:phage portal protein family protein [Flavobacterium sp. TN-1]
MKVLGFEFSIKKSPVSAIQEKTRTNTNPAILNIVSSFKDNSRKDIQKWRDALAMANHPKEPKLNLYYDLVDDLLTDGHLQSQIQMRKMATLNTEFEVYNRKTGKTNEELTSLINNQWFYEFLEITLDKIIFGHTLVEFKEFSGDKVNLSVIPRRNVVPAFKRIYPDLSKREFLQYDNENFKPWLLPLGNGNDLGIINNIIPNLIWLRNVFQSWAEFCEKFGLPLITATSSASDNTTIERVHQMLLELAEASVGTFPHGTEIKFNEANRTDAFRVYKEFIQSNAEVVSKLLVGSSTLSDQAGNRSQTEVHERTLDGKIAMADKRMIAFAINDQLFDLLILQGYKITPDDVFRFKTAQQEVDISQLWTITSGMINNGFTIDTNWLSQTFNIPLTLEKQKTPKLDATAQVKKKSQPVAYSVANKCGCEPLALGKSISSLLDSLCKELALAVWNNQETKGILGRMIQAEGLELLQGLRSNFKTINPYTGADVLALQMMEYNIFMFATSKAEKRMASMSQLLIDKNKKELRSYQQFELLCLQESENLNRNHLRTEYNLSVAVGQNSASYYRFMNEKDTVTSYVQYQTIGDDKVRSAHEVLNGKIFNLSDKEAMDLFPPNGFGCRCEMLQYIGETEGVVTKGAEAKRLLELTDSKFKGSAFDINRGDLKQVFTKKEFYVDAKGLPEKINDMTFDKYQLKLYEEFKDSLNSVQLDQTITPKNVKELFRKDKESDYMGFSDYLDRKLILSEKDFDRHVQGYYTGKDELRHQLFPHIQEVLSNPDEHWYFDYKNNGQKFQSRYIKFYKDRAIVVDCDIDPKTKSLKINTWYNMKQADHFVRKGLLVERKNL